jgi:hypothetical protein
MAEQFCVWYMCVCSLVSELLFFGRVLYFVKIGHVTDFVQASYVWASVCWRWKPIQDKGIGTEGGFPF